MHQDEHVLIHEGALFANSVSTGQRVKVDEAEWFAPSYPGFGPLGPWIVRGIEPEREAIHLTRHLNQ